MKSNLDSAKVRLANVRSASGQDKRMAQGVEAATVAYEVSSSIFERRQLDLERLLVRAPASGYFLAAPRIDAPNSDSSKLNDWHGSPLEQRNLGAYLNQSTFVGQVIDDMTQLEAVLAIDQSDIEFVRPSQKVELLIHQIPLKIFESETETISPSEMKSTPKSLSSKHGGDIVTITNRSGDDVPESTKYLVNVTLENPDQLILPGSSGKAKIRTGSQTVGQRIWRLISRTFQFEL